MTRSRFAIPGGPLALLSALTLISAMSAWAQEEEHTVRPPAYFSVEDWGSEPQPISDERRHTPTYITIHHSGVTWQQGQDPFTKIRNLQTWGQSDKDWPDVPYHWFIAPDGRLLEGRSMDYEPETNTSYDVNGHINVHVWGNFEEQRVSPQQMVTAVHTVAWLCQELGTDPATIGGHLDRCPPGETSCPGRDLYRYIEDGTFEAWVRAKMAGETPTIMMRPALEEGPTEMIPLD